MLIIFGGLPGTGKTTISRELARQIGAVYLRIDSIENALVRSGSVVEPMNDAGYCVAYAVAEDNLNQGLHVVADSVNPIFVTRQAWLDVAVRSGQSALEIEVICSDLTEHRRRIEERASDLPEFKMPTWLQVVNREYEIWSGTQLVIDTAAGNTLDHVECAKKLISL